MVNLLVQAIQNLSSLLPGLSVLCGVLHNIGIEVLYVLSNKKNDLNNNLQSQKENQSVSCHLIGKSKVEKENRPNRSPENWSS